MVANVKEGPVTPPFSPPTRVLKSSLRVDRSPLVLTLTHVLPLKSYIITVSVPRHTKVFCSLTKEFPFLATRSAGPEGQWVVGRVERDQVLC